MARVRERDLVIPALRAAANAGGEIAMTSLIAELTAEFQPDGEDAEIIQGRQDTKFSQKVRNLVSHRSASTSMFERGYATYQPDAESIAITELGQRFLDQVPE